MEYGLIGYPLGHSFSKDIHEKISSITYDLNPISTYDGLKELMTSKDLKGINVTIPYKKKVIKFLDEVSSKANEIGAVNTIVKKYNKLYGYNTDYLGFKRLLESNKMNPRGLTCLILGTGGTRNTVYTLLKDLGAKEIITASRQKKEGCITYNQLGNYTKKIEMIINTTPVGMYPNNYESLINIELFTKLKYVVDVIYNPLRTKLVLDAQRNNIKAIGGLEMLISQAIYANELFLDTKYDDSLFFKIYKEMYLEKTNIVLIGMPMSGKTNVGKRIARIFKKKFIDSDNEIIKKIKMPIKDYFEKYGEEAFRKIEHEKIVELSKLNNVIISTGGGVIKNFKNISLLKQNGFIVHLTRSEGLIDFKDDTRPLTKNLSDYRKLKKERFPLYRKAMDVEVMNKNNYKQVYKEIMEALDESINY